MVDLATLNCATGFYDLHAIGFWRTLGSAPSS